MECQPADNSHGRLPGHDGSSDQRGGAGLRILTGVWLAVVLLWCAVPLSPATTDGDFWGHVQYARDALRHGLDRTATYTYTAEGYRWVNHENLSELVFAVVTDHWGTGVLLGLKCLLGLSVLGLATVSRRVHPLCWAALWILTACNLSYYWATRPQIFSFTFFAWMLLTMELAFGAWSTELSWRGLIYRSQATAEWHALSARHQVQRSLRWLWLLPPLMLIWTNTHGGFLAGVAVTTVLLAGRLWQARVAPRCVWVPLAVVLLVTIGVTFINPYGWQLHAWLYGSLRNPRPEVIEWMPPDWWGPGSTKTWLLIATLVVSLAGTRLRRDPLHVALLVVVAWQSTEHRRHLPFLTILVLYWLAPHLESTVARWIQIPADLRRRQSATGLSTAWLTCGVLSACVLGAALSVSLWSRLAQMQVDRAVFPVAAVQHMADQRLTGKCLVSAQWAQYVLATLGGRFPGDGGIRVAFDGRYDTCYPQPVIDMYFDFDRGPGGPDRRWRGPDSPPCDPQRALDYLQPDFVLLARKNEFARQQLARQADRWELVYADSTAELWQRRAQVTSELPTRFVATPAAEQPRVSGGVERGWVAWPAAPRRP
ncbi:MAG: hypothetical protein U0795_01070 [Pirellulales bacterium]